MAKIVISNAIANIAELKSRLRGVKTPGKRILAAAFKNNDYSALIGELLTRIELYQSLGVLDYKTKDVDTIQNMKFKFGFESVLASTLKASGVSSSPRVVQQIVRQQQVMAPQKSMIGEELNPLAVEYTRNLTDSANRRLASKKAVDLFIGLSNRIKNVLSIGLDESLDRINVIEKNFNDFGMEDEDGKWNDIAEVRSEFSDFASQFGIDADDADDIFISIKDYTPSTGAPKVPFNIAGTYGALVEDWCSPSVFEMYKKIQAKVGDSVIQKAAAYIKAKQGKPSGLVGDPLGDSVYNILESAKIKTTYENRELVRQALQAIVANY